MDFQSFSDKKNEIIDHFVELIDEFNFDTFTKKDIGVVNKILTDYLVALRASEGAGDAAVMGCVKTAVLALNDLNERTEYGMIETEEREILWEFLQTAAVDAGLQNVPDDVTEEYREW